jgi:hypothetical protein
MLLIVARRHRARSQYANESIDIKYKHHGNDFLREIVRAWPAAPEE